MPPLPPVPPIWHPFTQHALFPTMTRITGASGGYLMRENGVPLMDCIASWWVVTHGHCHPRIVAAIQHQATVLDQVIFAGYTHAPAEELAQHVLERARQSSVAQNQIWCKLKNHQNILYYTTYTFTICVRCCRKIQKLY